MNSIFLEFENENAMRSYPFASGCPCEDSNGGKIDPSVFVDASFYPVNSKGALWLSGISADGVFTVSDDTGDIMSAAFEAGSRCLEFRDFSPLERHVGTLMASSAEALAVMARPAEGREFRKGSAALASTCVFPVTNAGVLTLLTDGGCVSGNVYFSNSDTDEVRVSTVDNTLRFDVLTRVVPDVLTSIRHVYCVVDGKTPFRILKLPKGDGSGTGPAGDSTGNTVAVYLDNIDRMDVCSAAHREDSLVMADECEDCKDDCHKDPDPPVELPDVYQVAVVDVPNGADGAFFLASPNFTGYDNPISITMDDGAILPKLELDVDVNGDNTDEIVDTLAAKGVVVQVPGLAKLSGTQGV